MFSCESVGLHINLSFLKSKPYGLSDPLKVPYITLFVGRIFCYHTKILVRCKIQVCSRKEHFHFVFLKLWNDLPVQTGLAITIDIEIFLCLCYN